MTGIVGAWDCSQQLEAEDMRVENLLPDLLCLLAFCRQVR